MGLAVPPYQLSYHFRHFASAESNCLRTDFNRNYDNFHYQLYRRNKVIVIFDWHLMTGEPNHRTATIYITNGTTPYMYVKGGLDESGDLQTLLNGIEAELYAAAVASGTVPTPKEQAKADRLIWLAGNPSAKQIFTLSSVALEAEITALVDAIIPTATAANRTKLKRLLMGNALVSRESVAGE